MFKIEHERKFVVNRNFLADLYDNAIDIKVVQSGYIDIDEDKLSQIRITLNSTDQKARINIKGTLHGFSRDEFQFKIKYDEASELMSNISSVVLKKRLKIPYEDKATGLNYIWDVDVFLGKNYPLVLAEIELDDPRELQDVPIPYWVTREVTDDPAFYNVNLAKSRREEKKSEMLCNSCIQKDNKEEGMNSDAVIEKATIQEES